MSNELILKERENLQDLLGLANQVILQTHYEHMDHLAPCAIDQNIAKVNPADVVCLFRITELVCKKEEGCVEALTTVLNALHSCDASCIMLLQCVEGRSELYLGAVNKKKCQNMFYLTTIQDVLRTALEGNLPGTEFQEIVSRSDVDRKLRECLDNGFDSQCITAVSCVAERSGEKASVDGLEKLLGAVGQKNFSIFILADPVNHSQMETIRQGYEELGTRLSEFESLSVSMQRGTGTTDTTNTSLTINDSLTRSISHTQNTSHSSGWSDGTSESKNDRKLLSGTISGAAGVLTAVTLQNPQAGFMAMSVVNGVVGGGQTQHGLNNSTNGSETHGTADQIGLGAQHGTAVQNGQSHAVNDNQSLTMQFTQKDRHIQGLLEKLDAYLKWLNRRENYGMFNCCAYIVSGSPSTNMLVASQYQALMQGDSEINQPITMNTWTQSNDVDTVRQSLLHLTHPEIEKESVRFSPAMLTSSKELACQMALPRESIVGVTVMEYEAFGREVVRKSMIPAGRVVRVGNITHMGKVDHSQPVLLDVQSLASHTFIAGTNGSGKSNTVFCILEELMKARIPFLVIEPAKGEYKNVFGLEDSVHIYGTNRNKTPLLHLNPFWFGPDIDVKEHIASLMSVFTASWSMYAAMSQVLNAAIENAYKACGWNIATSKCARHRVFPTVADVVDALQKKMSQTAFSDEVRGNYVGALSTRLEALSSGICADIFSGADIGDSALFESNVIIDLSRTGSSEISAMIMGMLLIRLEEYRKSEGAINHPLRHITVLEEAHHLLRRTSTVQSEDGANPMGKAVEMLSNAIAEMRSYGDGFIIADQSPGLLDESVLRNTNTKIIMRLPDGNDRELMGRTIGLSEKQTFELSRLKTGVAAIYQKDWLEAVLCQVDRAAHEEILYQYSPVQDEEKKRTLQIVKFFADQLLEGTPISANEVAEWILNSTLSGKKRRMLLRSLNRTKRNWRNCAPILATLLPVVMEYPESTEAEDLELWYLDTVLVNELDDIPDYLCRMVIAANAWVMAQEDIQWEKVAYFFYADDTEASLPKLRGAILSEVCGIHSSIASFDGDASILAEGSETDFRIWQLYQQYLKTGVCRQKGEIEPYAEIAWRLCGADVVWEKAMPYIADGNCSEWTNAVSTPLSTQVMYDTSLQFELLSLALQFKGKLPEVREFYYQWKEWFNNTYSIANSESTRKIPLTL